MYQEIKEYFNPPMAAVLMQRSIEHFQREQLIAEASAAYSYKMAEYYREGVERLKKQLKAYG